MDDGSYGILLIFALPVVLAAVLIAHRSRRLRAKGRRLTCADAVASARVRLEPDAYCDYAFELLRSARLTAAPVVVGNRFLGFFSRTEASRRSPCDLANTYVASIMIAARDCGCVRGDFKLDWAGRQLRRSPFSMLPVIDHNEKLLGFITEDSIHRVSRAYVTKT